MKEQLLLTLEKSRKYTLDVAEAMNESSYNFKPQGAGWNFSELLHHIAYSITWWQENFIKGNPVEWDQPQSKNGKRHVTTYLNKAYDELKSTVSAMQLTDDKITGFHSTIDHITHHRGQAVIYLRCSGSTPPEYTY